jgi:hypothetical protein
MKEGHTPDLELLFSNSRHTKHGKANVCNIGQGAAINSKYKRLKLGGGQACDRLND